MLLPIIESPGPDEAYRSIQGWPFNTRLTVQYKADCSTQRDTMIVHGPENLIITDYTNNQFNDPGLEIMISELPILRKVL
jgi:hypothetical protein